MRVLLALGIGILFGYLFGSERAREEARRRVASAPEPLRRATERVSEMVAASPLPDSMKQTASRATASVQSATERAAQAVTPAPELARATPAEVSGRPAEPLPTNTPAAPTA